MNDVIMQGGLTAKFLAMMAGVNHSTISRSIQSKSIKTITDTSRKNQRYHVSDCRKILTEYLASCVLLVLIKKSMPSITLKGVLGKRHTLLPSCYPFGFVWIQSSCDRCRCSGTSYSVFWVC